MKENTAPQITTWLNLVVLCFFILLGPALTLALESDKEQAIYIEADDVEIDDRSGISVYRGNVVFTQGTIRMTADEVTVTQKEGQSDRVVAVGDPVTYQQQMEKTGDLVRGRALRAEYDVAGDIIYMIDDAELSQGEDTFKNDRITYDRRREIVRAGASEQGKQRVRITIQPKRDQPAQP